MHDQSSSMRLANRQHLARYMARSLGESTDQEVFPLHPDANSNDSNHLILTLLELEEFVQAVLDNNCPAYEWITCPQGSHMPSHYTHLKIHALAKYFPKISNYLEVYSDAFRYSTLADLFFSCCVELQYGKDAYSRPQDPSGLGHPSVADSFNALISAIRIAAKQPEFRARRKAVRDNLRKRSQEYLAYVDELFKRHSRLLVIRVDLFYAKDYAHSVTVEQAKSDFNTFLNNFRHRDDLTQALRGYIWKLEFGSEKGYHYHCLFFYDGSKVQNDFHWGKQIGEYWQSTVSHGGYWNCNDTQNKAKFARNDKLGIGMMQRHDVQLRENLSVIVQYMLKSEQYILVKSLASQPRLVGKGTQVKHAYPQKK